MWKEPSESETTRDVGERDEIPDKMEEKAGQKSLTPYKQLGHAPEQPANLDAPAQLPCFDVLSLCVPFQPTSPWDMGCAQSKISPGLV